MDCPLPPKKRKWKKINFLADSDCEESNYADILAEEKYARRHDNRNVRDLGDACDSP